MSLKILFFIVLFLGLMRAEANDVNIAYVITEDNYKQVFTSISSLVQTFYGRDNQISFYMICLGKYKLDFSKLSEEIDGLITNRNFQSWRFYSIPIADEIAKINSELRYLEPIDELPKFMLGDILPEISRVIFLRADTLVIRNLRQLWIDYMDDKFPFSTVNGPYCHEIEGEKSKKFRHSIGCMLANLEIMRTNRFSQEIQNILLKERDRFEVKSDTDKDEFFRVSPVDLAFVQYLSNHSDTCIKPKLPIYYDALASSIPPMSLMRSAVGKIEEWKNLTVIDFAGMTNWDEALSGSDAWPYARWLRHVYLKYHVRNVDFPEKIGHSDECCDDQCCQPDCPCRLRPGWCALPLRVWVHFGTVRANIGAKLKSY